MVQKHGTDGGFEMETGSSGVPGRIFIHRSNRRAPNTHGSWSDQKFQPEDIEYICADIARELADGLVFVTSQLDEFINRHYGGDLPCTRQELDGLDKAACALAKWREATEEGS